VDAIAADLAGAPRSRREAEDSLARYIAETRLDHDDDGVTLAVERREDDLLLGTVTVWLRSVEHRQVEVGYVFHPDSGGHGYATEATRALIDFAFADLAAHRVIARTDARNTAFASLRLREEAHFREAEIFKGEGGEEPVFAVLAHEWRPAADPA
jgi:RimJ/RimL family protein N-acetyltransferase